MLYDEPMFFWMGIKGVGFLGTTRSGEALWVGAGVHLFSKSVYTVSEHCMYGLRS